MATTGKMNATLMGWYVGATQISHATEGSISIAMDTRDVTTKDSAGWRELLESTRSWSGSASAMYANDATYGLADLEAALVARTAVTVKFSTEVSGDDYYSGSAFITSLEASGGVEDTVTYSISFEGTGAITLAQVT